MLVALYLWVGPYKISFTSIGMPTGVVIVQILFSNYIVEISCMQLLVIARRDYLTINVLF